MTKEEIIQVLEEKGLNEILKLIKDAKRGKYDELELVESLGLLHDETLNQEVIKLLEELGVTIVYVTEEDLEDEEGEEEETEEQN